MPIGHTAAQPVQDELGEDILERPYGLDFYEGRWDFWECHAYTELPTWRGDRTELLERTGEITEQLRQQVDYALDGMVADATDLPLREHMGATSHHYRWQIAIKERGEEAAPGRAPTPWGRPARAQERREQAARAPRRRTVEVQ